MMFKTNVFLAASTGALTIHAIQLGGDGDTTQLTTKDYHDEDGSNKGLSTGAKVGLGVAAVAVVATVVAVSVVLTQDDDNGGSNNDSVAGLPDGYTSRDVCNFGQGSDGDNNVLDSSWSGDRRCTLVQGDLLINSGGEVDLISLIPNLELINGDLLVEENEEITKLTMASPNRFFDELLVDIKGAIRIQNTTNLEEVNLRQLVTLGGDMILNNNDMLRSFAVENLYSIGPVSFPDRCFDFPCNLESDETKLLNVQFNDNLESLVMPELRYAQSVSVNDNPALVEASFPGLSELHFDFDFKNNEALDNVGAPVLIYVGRNFVFENNILSTFDAKATSTINGDYKFVNNPGLANLDYFVCCYFTYIGGNIDVTNNDALTIVQIPQFDFDVSENTAITFSGNDALETVSINGMPNVGAEFMIRDITIENNIALTNFFMNDVESITGSLIFDNNPLLSNGNLQGLRTISDDLVFRNTGVADPLFSRGEVNNLVRLNTVGGTLIIEDNNESIDTFELSALGQIGTLSARRNSYLETLSLPALTTVSPKFVPGTSFTVASNEMLSVLDLSALDFDTIDILPISIEDNADTCTCACPEELGDTCDFTNVPGQNVFAMPEAPAGQTA